MGLIINKYNLTFQVAKEYFDIKKVEERSTIVKNIKKGSKNISFKSINPAVTCDYVAPYRNLC